MPTPIETLTDLCPEEFCAGLPAGEYLWEHRGAMLLLWRISEGAPPDGAESPAGDWTISHDRPFAVPVG